MNKDQLDAELNILASKLVAELDDIFALGSKRDANEAATTARAWQVVRDGLEVAAVCMDCATERLKLLAGQRDGEPPFSPDCSYTKPPTGLLVGNRPDGRDEYRYCRCAETDDKECEVHPPDTAYDRAIARNNAEQELLDLLNT